MSRDCQLFETLDGFNVAFWPRELEVAEFCFDCSAP